MKSKPTQVQKKTRYAVAGLGHIAQVAVLPAFKTSKNSELAAIISGDPKKQKELGKKYKLDRVYSYEEYEECLADGIDAVYVAVPNHLHREFTLKAIRAGVHVLCEKPMAPTEADCRVMIGAAEDAGVKLMIAYRLHFEPANLRAIEIANSGKLGELRFFSSDFGQLVEEDNIRVTEPVERGGGPIYDMGVYCINAARYLLRDEPTHIFATSASDGKRRFQTEEMTSVIMRFPNERFANFTASFGSAPVSRYSLVGRKGMITADPAYEYASGLKLQITIDEKPQEKKFPKVDQFAAELTYFSECIQQDRDPEPSGWEGLADVRIVEAIYKSVRTARVIELPPFHKQARPKREQEMRHPGHGKPRTVNAKSPSGEAA
jgi:predicted dehydrogenase